MFVVGIVGVISWQVLKEDGESKKAFDFSSWFLVREGAQASEQARTIR